MKLFLIKQLTILFDYITSHLTLHSISEFYDILFNKTIILCDIMFKIKCIKL